MNEQLLQGYWGSSDSKQRQRQHEQQSGGLLDGSETAFSGLNLMDNAQQQQQEILGQLQLGSMFRATTGNPSGGSAGACVAPGPLIDVGQAANLTAEGLAQDAERVASNMATTGYCFRGVKGALRQNGINLFGGSAHMADEQLDQLVSQGRVVKVSPNDIRRGDIVVHGSSYRSRSGRTGSEHGHIAVALGRDQNGRLLEASDHIQSMIQSDSMEVYRLA